MSVETWWLLESGNSDCAANMALDEALLEGMPRLQRPVLRFYGWTQAAASFGYFQKYGEVERLTPLRPLVRRPTGGGIVPHDCDWTYSVVLPATHEWYAISAKESYRRVHEWVRAAFEIIGVRSELAPEARKEQPGQCFAGFEQSDLLRLGRKIAGAAQRRRRDGLLIQGSVQSGESSVTRSEWEAAMCQEGERQRGRQFVAWTPDGPTRTRVEQLAAAKYSQPSYNQRR
jgi:lipoate-protein ligase A